MKIETMHIENFLMLCDLSSHFDAYHMRRKVSSSIHFNLMAQYG